jgi:hypothetical protein
MDSITIHELDWSIIMFDLKERAFVRRFTTRFLYFSVFVPSAFIIAQAVLHVFFYVEFYALEPFHKHVVDPAGELVLDLLIKPEFGIPAVLLTIWFLILMVSVSCEVHRVGPRPTWSVVKFAVFKAAGGTLWILNTIFHKSLVWGLEYLGLTVVQTPMFWKITRASRHNSDND